MIIYKIIILLIVIIHNTNAYIYNNTFKNKNSDIVITSKDNADKIQKYKMENDYLIETGRKKKKGGNSNTNNIEIVSGGGDHGGYEHGDDVSYEMVHFKQKGKKQKMKKGKKRKGYTKYVKSMTPIGLCILALKMLLQHFFIKKLAVFALGSFLLSKTSFILSTLLALKQLFHSNGHEKSDSGGKLEVVHIPIRKKHPDFHDRDNVETIKYIPITYPADIYDQTTPHFIDYQYPNYENHGTLVTK
uniref:CSON005814 protein n=1 Tax=Culicoides sonorensis TaxID=179676 RepID=A0A336MXJ7_CULSO